MSDVKIIYLSPLLLGFTTKRLESLGKDGVRLMRERSIETVGGRVRDVFKLGNDFYVAENGEIVADVSNNKDKSQFVSSGCYSYLLPLLSADMITSSQVLKTITSYKKTIGIFTLDALACSFCGETYSEISSEDIGDSIGGQNGDEFDNFFNFLQNDIAIIDYLYFEFQNGGRLACVADYQGKGPAIFFNSVCAGSAEKYQAFVFMAVFNISETTIVLDEVISMSPFFELKKALLGKNRAVI